MADRNPIAEREKFVVGWNKTMVDIWVERIRLLNVINTGALLASTIYLPVKADGRFYSFELTHNFLEYGLWQDLGTGREIPIGNPGDVKCLDMEYREEHGLNIPRKRGKKWGGGMTSGHPREPRRWYSTKYYSSYMRLRDFIAESLGDEFKAMFCNELDADRVKRSTDYYRRKGLG